MSPTFIYREFNITYGIKLGLPVVRRVYTPKQNCNDTKPYKLTAQPLSQGKAVMYCGAAGVFSHELAASSQMSSQ
jgi:hypothetical protein